MSFDKIKGISFTIDNAELTKLELMPEYYTIIRLYSIEGQNKSNIHYPLKYPPANFNSWQQFGRVMILIKKIFPSATFEDVEATGSYVYTLQEFASHFPEFVELPKPYYPQDKNDYMRHLTFYAMRLHFKGLFNIGLINAMAIKFNVFIGSIFSIKEIYSKAYSVFKLDRSQWKVQKGKSNNSASARKRKQLQEDKITIISSHIKDFTVNDKLDVTKMSLHLGIPKRTLYSLLKKHHSRNNNTPHITKPNGTNTSNSIEDDIRSCTILQSQMAQKETA